MRMRDFVELKHGSLDLDVGPMHALLSCAATFAVLGLCMKLMEAASEPVAEERILYFDFWRCFCVALVVICHCWEGYHEQNFFGANQWVLQIITLIAGTCFARGRGRLWRYSLRLMTFWGLGTLLNWIALVAIHSPKRNDPASVPFQMSYCVLLVGGAILVAPLKWVLEDNKANEALWTRHGVVALGYFLALLGLLPWACHPTWLGPHLQRAPVELLESVGLPLFVSVGFLVLPKPWIGWVHLALLELSRVVSAEPRPGSELHLLDLYVWAAVVARVPMAYQAKLGRALAQWWPVWAVACAFMLGFPGTDPPFPAQNPSREVVKRLRFYTVETIFVLAFTSIPSAGKDCSVTLPPSSALLLRWLNYLALAAFCTHKAIIDVVQHYL